MATPTTTMRLDEQLKADAKEVLDELGMTLTSATTVFLKAVVRCQGIPFDLTLGDGQGHRAFDFAAEYLAPIMSERNEIERVGMSPARLRKRLLRRNELVNRGRRTIA